MLKPAPTSAVRRVAFIGHSGHALQRFRGGLMREVTARRHRVLAMAPEFEGKAIEALARHDIATASFPLEPQTAGPFAQRRTEKSIAEALSQFKPHIVVASGSRTAGLGTTIGRASGADRIVMIVNGLTALGLGEESAGGWLREGSARRRRKAAIAAADLIVFHNPDDPRRLIADEVMPAEKPHIVTAGSGVDLAHFAAAPLPPLADGLNFLMAARLNAGQGVLAFAEAAQQVKAKAQGARFVLAGMTCHQPGALTPPQLARVKEAVELTADVDDMRPLLAASHVVVHPSTSEGLAGVLLEALATGRPVIAGDVPGSRLTVDERVNGMLVPPGDAATLALAIESFLRRPDLIPAMARAARAKAERLFDERAVIAAMLAALNID